MALKMIVCAANKNRSVTAAWLLNLADRDNQYFSRGSCQAACRIHGGTYCSQEDYDDAEAIICMDNRNKREIEATYGTSKNITVLGIEDKYKAFSSELMKEILLKVDLSS